MVNYKDSFIYKYPDIQLIVPRYKISTGIK